MNKIPREKASISVAFSSGLNKLQSKKFNEDSTTALQSSTRSLIKKCLRAIARKGYQLAKPILRPVALRARHYFLADLQQEISTIQKEQQSSLEKLEQIKAQIEAKANRMIIPCGQDELIIEIDSGYILCPTANKDKLIALVSREKFKKGTSRFIQNFLRPHNIFIDVGANIGIYTLAAAKALEGSGKIFAFEPNKSSQELLKKSMLMNGYTHLVKIHQAAVSKLNENQSLFPFNASEEIQVVRLDEEIPNKQRVDLIKINAQGAELDVLASAKTIIMENPGIGLIVKFKPANLKLCNQTIENWFKAFADLQLIHKVINSSTGELEDWPQKQLEARDSINLFFARQNSSAWKKAIL